MSRKDPRMERLARVADLASDHAMSALAGLQAKIRDIEAEIADLRAQDPQAAEPSAYACAGGGEKWHRWRDARVKERLRDLARLRADESQLRTNAAQSLAKARLVRKLQE